MTSSSRCKQQHSAREDCGLPGISSSPGKIWSVSYNVLSCLMMSYLILVLACLGVDSTAEVNTDDMDLVTTEVQAMQDRIRQSWGRRLEVVNVTIHVPSLLFGVR